MSKNPIVKTPFQERLKSDEPILYDGGFGSQLFARGIELANSALANELHPTSVIDIHSDYINAGAEAIGTNTFVASPLHLEMAGTRHIGRTTAHTTRCSTCESRCRTERKRGIYCRLRGTLPWCN